MAMIPDKSVDLIVIDPPYNIGKDKRWDKWKTVEEYVSWMTDVFKECERVLKPTGSFYWFHNDMAQVRKLMDTVDIETRFVYKNFIIWNKRYEGSQRKYYFDNVLKTESSRTFRPLTEYCIFYTLQGQDAEYERRSYILRPFIEYMNEVKIKHGISHEVIGKAFGYSDGGKKWFRYDQPRLLSREKYKKLQSIYPQFYKSYADLEHEASERNKEYGKMRYTYNTQGTHHDVWDYEVAPKLGHVTPKPVEMIENIIRHSSNEGDVVLDCFMGSGTTAVAATRLNRNFIGFERESEYVRIANQRLEAIQDGMAEHRLTE
jgi:DNA modification methylase